MNGPAEVTTGRIHVIVSTDTDLLALRTAIESLPDGFPAVTAATTWAPDPIGDLHGVSCVLVRLLGGRRAWPEGFDRLRTECSQRGAALLAFAGEAVPDAELTAASTVPSATVTEAFAYLVHGGPANLGNLLRFVADTVCFDGWGFEPPSPIAEHGIWCQPEPAGIGPVVGIVFYRAHLVAGNTEFVDDLCAAVRAAGGRPLALWCYTLRDRAARPIVDILASYGARALITTVLAAGGAAAAAGTPGARGGLDGEGWDVSELAELDIPVVQAPSAGRSSEDWAASDAGLGPYDVTSGVAIPELDGRIIAPAFAFSEVVDDGDQLGTSVRAYRSIPDRAARVAGLAVRLAGLRAKPPAERRVAIVLSAYPTKRSRLGNAVGLDTPASALVVLDALAAAGYLVEARPHDGDTLMAALADGLTYDADELTDDQLDLAVGRLPAREYAEWFATLPDAAREELESVWGPPPGRHRVHDGQLVFSGVELGNVVIAIQPPRGYGDDPVATRGRTPRGLELLLGCPGQRGEPLGVTPGGQAADRHVELLVGDVLGVIGHPVGQHGHEAVAVRRPRLDAVARAGERVEDDEGGSRRVEADGVPQAASLRRVGGEHDRDSPVRGWRGTQAREAQREACDPSCPVGNAPVGLDAGAELVAVVDDLAEREGRGDDASVELRNGDARGDVEGTEPRVGRRPLVARASGGGSLDDGDVQLRQLRDVPAVTFGPSWCARRAGRGGRSPCGEHRRDEDPGTVAAEQFDDRRGGPIAQRVAPDCERASPRRADRGAQVVDELGVPRDQVGSIEDDAHHRACSPPSRLPPDAVVRDRAGRLEAPSVEADGICHEAEELLEVAGTPVGQVGECLGDRGARHGRGRSQLRVEDRFPAEGQQRDPSLGALGPQAVESLRPRPATAEEAYQDAAGSVEVPDRVGYPGRRGADRTEALRQALDRSAQREQVGVRGHDHMDPTCCRRRRAHACASRRRLQPSHVRPPDVRYHRQHAERCQPQSAPCVSNHPVPASHGACVRS